MMSEYENIQTADIVADALIDWKVEFIFGLPGDGINGFIEALLRKRQNKINLYLLDMKSLQHLWHMHMPNIQEN
jgi:pyruvate dehydrogenase (quinone)